MNRLRTFLLTTLLGGLAVILPLTIIVVVFRWFYALLSDGLRWLTDQWHVTAEAPWVGELLSIILVLLICFLLGLLMRTSAGRWTITLVEDRLLRRIPLYGTVKETVQQLLGTEKSPFSQVALVNAGAEDVWQTGFCTDSHADGSYTVFVPTGPNPTSGFIYHLPATRVRLLEVKVEEAMRTVISCGAGSAQLIAGRNEPAPGGDGGG